VNGHGTATLLLELGLVIVGLAVLARVARRVGISPIPFYLLAGLAFGRGGLHPLPASEAFVSGAAQVGAVLLLLTLGLEYSADEFAQSLRRAAPAGLADLVLNFTPGFAAGLLFGWSALAAAYLGGVTLMTSSGIMSKVVTDLGRASAPETGVVFSIAVLEDLIMAVYLPLVAALAGEDVSSGLLTAAIAGTTVVVILVVARRFGAALSRLAYSASDEVLLLTVLGVTLVAAGGAERLQISAAVGAFLVGIALTGPAAKRAATLLSPLRDLFAAVFFLLFGLEVDPSDLPPVLATAAALAVVTAATKVATGWWAARREGIDAAGRWCAGTMLIPRGEFSIVIAGLAVSAGVEPRLAALAAAYVMLLAVGGPVASRFTGRRGPVPDARDDRRITS
jgi:monovalent cation:H+ antiporter-2, CPA2 family